LEVKKEGRIKKAGVLMIELRLSNIERSAKEEGDAYGELAFRED
jgi:hypothetical protein